MANQISVNSGTGNQQITVTSTGDVQVTTSRSVIGTISNVPTANFANYAANVTSSSQPNITSLGTLTSLNVAGNGTVNNLTVTGNLSVGNLFANNANYANFAGEAFNVSGSNVTGIVANATFATSAGTSNSATIAASANSVAGANVTGTVANATFATSAGTSNSATVANSANSVTLANVSGAGNIASINLDGNASNILFGNGSFSAIPAVSNVANANYANFAGTAYSVSGSNVSGEVANAAYANAANTSNLATYATTANSVAGANVSGVVANANYSAYANIANSANNVAVGNVSGIGNIAVINLDGSSSNVLFGNGVFAPESTSIANANYANFAGTAYNISGANVSGEVANANYATFAGTAYSVSGANVSGAVANANFATYSNLASFANVVTDNSQPNITSVGTLGNLVVSGNITANVVSSNLYTSPNVTTIAGNIIDLQFKVDGVLDTDGHWYIDNDGYYLPFGSFLQDYGQNGGSNISGFAFDGEITSGSNVITNVTLYDANLYDLYDLDSMSSFLVGQYIYINLNGIVNDAIFPVLTKITAVDTATATITVNNNALQSQSFNWNGFTGVSLSDSVHTNYRILSRQFLTTVLSTSSTGNIITCYNANPIADIFVDTPIVFSGNVGGITPNQTYWVLTADGVTNEITISATQGGPEVALTTDTGVMNINSQLLDTTVIGSSAQFYFAGPYPAVGLAYSGYTVDPDPNFTTDPTLTYDFSTNSTDFNSDVDQPTHYTRIDGGMVIGTDITDTLTGTLSDSFVNGGLTVGHSGLSTQTDPSGSFPRADMRIINYTNNGSDTASILSPGNPPTIGWTTYTGNINTPLDQQYLRNGRVIGRLTWTGRAQNGQNGGSRPPASIQVQALGDWTGNSEPMGMFMQYTPSSITNAVNNGGQPRTWLSAANNTTRMNGATNIQFGPTKTNGNSNQIRALSGVSDQTWVEVSGYTTGNAISNGLGGLLNITTTSGSQIGDVALRLSRTVGNTANMEFVLPVANTNTMTLKDNASGNTIATFTNGDVKMANATIDTGGFMKLSSYTATALTAITGQIGWMAAVSDSAGGGNPNGMIAFWDTTNSRWSYVHDNGAV